jgi:conjugal transfer pilus assembly protein TraL
MTDIPQTLDDPPKILFWDMDQAMVFILMIGVGIAVSSTFTFAIVGTVAAYFFGKAKSGKHRGFAKHLIYWFTPATLGMRRTPPSYIREYLG